LEKLKIVIYAQQERNRQELQALLGKQPDLDVIDVAGNGIEIYKYYASRLFNILVFDLTGADELDILRTESIYGIKTVVVYDEKNIMNIDEMLRCGAKAYVSVECVSTELAAAIRDANNGKVFLSYPLFEHAIENYIKEKPTVKTTYELLTKRESEIFNLVVKGLTSTQIGEVLDISRRTVEIHRANMLRKLNLATQCNQIRNYARELGILENEKWNPLRILEIQK
jgi:two-component system, NarL family, response regulator NreC